jgi:hypothetical protein
MEIVAKPYSMMLAADTKMGIGQNGDLPWGRLS